MEKNGSFPDCKISECDLAFYVNLETKSRTDGFDSLYRLLRLQGDLLNMLLHAVLSDYVRPNISGISLLTLLRRAQSASPW